MDIDTSVAASATLPLERYAHVTGRTFPEVLTRAARGVVKRGIRITPPYFDGESDSEAKARGARAVERDLHTLFAPVRLKGKRRERISGAEMVRLHAEALRRKRPGTPMRRAGAQPLYVDVRKFNVLRDKLRANVGKLASGWVAAATVVKTPAPAWVSRHGASRGSAQIELSSTDLYFEAVNYAKNVPNWIRTETQRRLRYAVEYQANAMNREMQAILLKRARESGLGATSA